MLTKAAIIISAVLVFAGVAAAGTLTSGSSDDTPTIQNATLPTTTTSDDVRQEDRQANEPGEDLSGPCDEAEHANDPRCTGVGAVADDRGADDGVDDNGHHDQNRGHGGDDDGSSGHGGGNSGHGGGDDD